MIITMMIMVIIFSGKACDRPHILGWASVRARGAVLTRDTHPKIYTVYIPTVYLPRYTQCISPLCICQDIHSCTLCICQDTQCTSTLYNHTHSTLLKTESYMLYLMQCNINVHQSAACEVKAELAHILPAPAAPP